MYVNKRDATIGGLITLIIIGIVALGAMGVEEMHKDWKEDRVNECKMACSYEGHTATAYKASIIKGYNICNCMMQSGQVTQKVVD